MKKDSWNPSQYEKFKNERSQPFLDLLDLVQPFSEGKVIDLGSGTGELTSLMHDTFKPRATVGFELSDAMLEKAKRFSKPGLSFVQGNIENWKPNDTYDLALSNAAIQWCSDHVEIFSKIKSALKTGGQIAVQMPMNHDYPTHVLAKSLSEEPEWSGLLKGQTYNKFNVMLAPEDYARLLFKLGFKEQNVFVKVYGHTLESREQVVEWVKGSMLTHFQSRLSEENYDKFLSEFRERLFKILPDERPFFYPFKRIFIWGRLDK
ncbi:methyltransferase domain-containing protein [Bdellovibrio sp. BCCA]|uniref:methyltransferase domain-containing protein n=1 Tax=Bdellovibrio sp. BCCA TaxID=3136281 RepID=UPI0030F266EC